MTQTRPKTIIVGTILGAHGVRGDVRVKSFTDDPEALFAYGALLSAGGETLLTPKSFRLAKSHFIVTPAESKQKEEWDALKGTKLHIARSDLPETESGEFYISDLIGLEAQNPDGKPLGKVKAVMDHGAGDLLEILMPDQKRSVFIPFTEVDVPEVDLAKGVVKIASFDIWSDEEADKDERD